MTGLDVDQPDECEREDCRRIAATASEVYCDITGGLLSYPTYDARTILAHAYEETEKLIREATAEIEAERVGAVEAVQRVRQAIDDVTARRESLAPGDQARLILQEVEADLLAALEGQQ